MFEEYLQDSYEFFSLGNRSAEKSIEREARRYYRSSVFYALGSIEAFVNYHADSFAKAGSLTQHEISFLNDKAIVFVVDKGVTEKTEYHRLDDKLRLLMRKFVRDFDFQGRTWGKFMEFKNFRDSLVHRKRPVNLSITHKFGFLVHDRFDFVGGVERKVHGALARASRRSASMSL